MTYYVKFSLPVEYEVEVEASSVKQAMNLVEKKFNFEIDPTFGVSVNDENDEEAELHYSSSDPDEKCNPKLLAVWDEDGEPLWNDFEGFLD